MKDRKIKCKGCKKQPSELQEFIEDSEELGVSPDDCVIHTEPTYNPRTKRFMCSLCSRFAEHRLEEWLLSKRLKK